VKDFVPDFRFELGAVRVCIVSAIAACRVFLDDARLAPDTDRATEVECFAAPSDGECHVVIASINAWY
jgi:hypothetical protein